VNRPQRVARAVRGPVAMGRARPQPHAPGRRGHGSACCGGHGRDGRSRGPGRAV